MDHPDIEEIIAGTASRHVARCETCRKLGALAGALVPVAPDAAGFAVIDEDVYTDWSALDARGGMGQIFRARDRRLGRYVAIKQLRRDVPDHGNLRQRFEREARLTARLQHPAIVGVYEAGVLRDGEPFYAMPLLRGAPLTTEIVHRTTLEDRLGLLTNVIAVVDAVAYAHDTGIVHRDLKPDNILVGTFGETVLIDWGLAKDLHEGVGELDGVYRTLPSDGMTQMGAGTAHYMPPEQARGEEPDERADIYALGATLYHVLAGHPPYAGDGSTDVRRTLATGASAPRLPDEVPPELADIVAKAMTHEPAGRYASARDLADELRRFQTGQLLTSRRYSFAELVRHFARRHRTALRIVAIALAAVLAVVVIAFVRIGRARDQAERNEVRAERELRRSQGIVASRTANDPDQRLAAIELAVGALDPAVPETLQGLIDAFAAGPPLVPLAHDGVIKSFARAGDRLLGIDDARSLVVWQLPGGAQIARWPSALPEPERAVVSPDGTRALVCGFDPSAEVFDLATGAHRRIEANANLEGCGFLPDGRIITAADAVVVRDPRTLAVAQRFALPAPAAGMAVGAHHVAVATVDGTLWLWDLTGEPRAIATKLPLGSALAFDADERTLLDNGTDQVTRAFALSGGDPTVVYTESGHALGALASSHAHIAIGTWDTDETRSTVIVPSAGGAHVTAPGMFAAWLDDERAIVGGAGAAVIDAATGGVVVPLGNPKGELQALALGDGRVATASRDGQAYLWDLHGIPLGTTGEITELARHGDRVLATSLDGSVWSWATATPSAMRRLHTGREVMAALWLGDAVVIADLAGEVRILSDDGRDVARATLPGPIRALATDGFRVAIGALDGTLEVRDSQLRTVAHVATGSAVTAVAIRGDQLASAHADGSTRLWTATGQPIASAADADRVDEPGDHEGSIALAFSGASLIVGRPADKTLVLAVPGLALERTIEGRYLTGTDAIITALGDGSVVGPGGRYTGSRTPVLVAARVGARLIGGSSDGHVYAWDAAGAPTLTIAGPAAVTALAAIDDGVLAGFSDGAVRWYPLTVAAARARACAVLARFTRQCK